MSPLVATERTNAVLPFCRTVTQNRHARGNCLWHIVKKLEAGASSVVKMAG